MHAILCTSCSSSDVRRSARRSLNDHVASQFGWLPYRCRACHKRFRMQLGESRNWRTPMIVLALVLLGGSGIAAGSYALLHRQAPKPTAQVPASTERSLQDIVNDDLRNAQRTDTRAASTGDPSGAPITADVILKWKSLGYSDRQMIQAMHQGRIATPFSTQEQERLRNRGINPAVLAAAKQQAEAVPADAGKPSPLGR